MHCVALLCCFQPSPFWLSLVPLLEHTWRLEALSPLPRPHCPKHMRPLAVSDLLWLTDTAPSRWGPGHRAPLSPEHHLTVTAQAQPLSAPMVQWWSWGGRHMCPRVEKINHNRLYKDWAPGQTLGTSVAWRDGLYRTKCYTAMEIVRVAVMWCFEKL